MHYVCSKIDYNNDDFNSCDGGIMVVVTISSKRSPSVVANGFVDRWRAGPAGHRGIYRRIYLVVLI